MNTTRLRLTVPLLAAIGLGCGRDSAVAPLADGSVDRPMGHGPLYADAGPLEAGADATEAAPDGDRAELALAPAMGPPLPVGRSMRFLPLVRVGPALRDLSFDPLLTFRTENPGVATVSSRGGEVRAVAAGQTRLRAQHPRFGEAEALLPVTTAAVARIDIDPSRVRLTIGGRAELGARAIYSNGTQADVTQAATWSSSNARIVRVGTGLTPAGGLEGLSAGTAVVAASFAGARGEIRVTIGDGGPMDLGVFPPVATVALGEVAAFQALWRAPDGTLADISSQALWTVSNPSIAAPLGAGRFRCQSLATALVRADYMNQEAETTLHCDPAGGADGGAPPAGQSRSVVR